MSGDAETPAISVRSAAFGWPNGASFEIERWRAPRRARIALVGASGGGKTTLLSALAGLLELRRGALEILGRDMAGLSGPRRDRLRGDHFGIVFQMFNLLPYAGALENVLLPLSFSRRRRAAAGADRPIADEAARLLSALGLDPADLGQRAAAELSVGQQQRVAAARALIGRPEILLADEPTSALDPASAEDFLSLLFAEAAAAGAAVICVTHDPGVAERFDETVRVEDVLKRVEAA